MRPVTMPALSAFFAMIPAALALERGSEANAPNLEGAGSGERV